MKETLDQIHIVKDCQSGKFICSAEVNGERFNATYGDLQMATAWAETVADYSVMAKEM